MAVWGIMVVSAVSCYEYNFIIHSSYICIGIQTCRKTSTANMHTRLGAQMTRHNFSELYSLLHNDGKHICNNT